MRKIAEETSDKYMKYLKSVEKGLAEQFDCSE